MCDGYRFRLRPGPNIALARPSIEIILIDDRKTSAGRAILTSGAIHLSYARENVFSDSAYCLSRVQLCKEGSIANEIGQK